MVYNFFRQASLKKGETKMKSLLWLALGVTIVILITQIKTVLGLQGPVVVSSMRDLVWAWRGFGALVVLVGAFSVSSIMFLRSVKAL